MGVCSRVEAARVRSAASIRASRTLSVPPTGQTWKVYYPSAALRAGFAGAQRLAVRELTASSDTLYYLHSDPLGSTSLTTNATGGWVGEMKYLPYGSPRPGYPTGSVPTERRFTGQRSEEATLGSLYDYGARFYSPVVGRFLSADSIVPQVENPQAWNRYSYTVNNPPKYTDPSGHCFGFLGGVDTAFCAMVIDALLFGGTALVSIGFVKVAGDAIQDAARNASLPNISVDQEVVAETAIVSSVGLPGLILMTRKVQAEAGIGSKNFKPYNESRDTLGRNTEPPDSNDPRNLSRARRGVVRGAMCIGAIGGLSYLLFHTITNECPQ